MAAPSSLAHSCCDRGGSHLGEETAGGPVLPHLPHAVLVIRGIPGGARAQPTGCPGAGVGHRGAGGREQ